MGDFWRQFYDDPQLRLPAGTYRITAEAHYGPPECAPTQQVAASIVIEVVDAPDPTVTPPVNGTRHLRLDGIELDYPASWTANDQGWPSTGFGWTVAVIGTLPWGPCARHDLNCHYQQRLQPGQISVDIGQLFLSREDICQLGRTRSDLEGRGPENPIATGSLARVDGRPALRTDYDVRQADYYRSDEWRSWVIAVPGSVDRAFTIHAKYRGPGVARMRRELDELIASIRLSPASEPEPGPDDCGPPFPPP